MRFHGTQSPKVWASIACFCSVFVLNAHADRPTLDAQYRADGPVLDGRLDESFWRDVPSSDVFVERKPRLAQQPKVRTVLKVAFTKTHVYVGLFCEDDAPPSGLNSVRDSFAIFRDDAVSLKIDAALDGRTTLGFVTNPSGAMLDYRGINESEFRGEFDALWAVRAAIVSGGWSAEFRIPWSSLGLDPSNPPDEIGFNVSRDHPRFNATYDWALMPPPFSPISASLYGRITGFSVLRDQQQMGTGRRVGRSILGYVTGGFRRDARDDSPTTDAVYNGGIDASLGLGQSFSARITVNTYFAQVDVDDQFINLDRFGLFLPEKREFFLTDLEIFTFGVSKQSQLLYTRRIGLKNGLEVPILSGLKLVSRPSKAYRVGLLQVVTRDTGELPWTSHLVARSLLELGGGSNVGVMLTHRGSFENAQDFNLAVGVDGAYRGVNNPLLIEAFSLVTFTGREAGDREPAVGGEHSSLAPTAPAPGGRIRITWRDLLWRPTVAYSYYHEGLRTDLGFFRRVNVHDASGELVYEPRIGTGGIEKIRVSVGGNAIADGGDGELLDALGEVSTDVIWNAGYQVGLSGSFGKVTAQRPFTVGAIEIPIGTYDSAVVELSGRTPSVEVVSAQLSVRWEDYFGGNLVGGRASLVARPSSIFRLEATASYDYATFSDERPNLNSAVVNARFAFGFTPTLGWTNFVGYNYLGDSLRIQSRLRWTWAPGSDVFLVYQIDVGLNGLAHEDFQSLLVKWTLRFSDVI